MEVSKVRWSNRRTYTGEILEFIRENAPGKYNKELTELVNGAFGTKYTVRQIRNIKSGNGITAHVNGNQIPSKPPEPIGTERARRGGIYVKVSDIPNNESMNWRRKHHVIWEKHHGDVPENHVVLFQDGDKTNFNIENLKCVHRRVSRNLEALGGLTDDLRINESRIALAKLDNKINFIDVMGGNEKRYNHYREVAKMNGINCKVFYDRLVNGWSLECAATQPVRKYRRRSD